LKKTLLLIITLLLICLSFVGCNTNDSDKKVGKELEISTYAKNTYLEEVAKEYQKQNPDIKINIITFANDLTMEVSNEKEYSEDNSPRDYIKNINTAFIAKKGSDIINMDVLPYYKYASSSYLADLSELIENDSEFKKDEYYSKILDSLKVNSKLYMMPIDYMAYIGGVNKNFSSDINNYKVSNFLDLGYKNLKDKDEKGVYVYDDPYDLFNILYEENYTKLVDLDAKKSNFNSNEFKNILDNINMLKKENLLIDSNDIGEENYLKYFKYDSIWTQDLLTPHFGFNDDFVDMNLIKDCDDKVYFDVIHSYAINENSNNKELAWDFIKFMINEESQSSPGIFPINKKALNNSYKEQIRQMLNDANENGMALDDDVDKICDEYIAKLSDFSEQINTYHFKDYNIDNIVKEEVKAFIDEKKDKDDVINAISMKVDTYLQE
jgi:multiple sugar transport system substrate-binding protein